MYVLVQQFAARLLPGTDCGKAPSIIGLAKVLPTGSGVTFTITGVEVALCPLFVQVTIHWYQVGAVALVVRVELFAPPTLE